MCGIIGYTGEKQALAIVLEGLTKLEYRGYDSAGVAIHDGEDFVVRKKAGKLVNLQQSLASEQLPGTLGMGHTRWATHGGVTDQNAHPHSSPDEELVLVHNGIIENYQELKQDLLQRGDTFLSETDTEVLAHLIQAQYLDLCQDDASCRTISNPFTEAVRRALEQTEGGYAIVAMHRRYPDQIVAARRHNPLIVGFGSGENLVASDIPALLNYTDRVYDLKNGEIAQITKHEVNIYQLSGKQIDYQPRTVSWSPEQAEKDGYPHFLIKEIHETPRVVREVLSGKLSQRQIRPTELGLDDLDLAEINKITFLACGSAAYACLYGKYLFEKWAGITSEVFVGSEYRYHEPVIDGRTLIIALSQSGETADTLASIAKARQADPARIIGVINAVGSSMTGEVDTVCQLNAGPEISVASTKAFSAMITTLALMALYTGQKRRPDADLSSYLDEISQLPELIEQVLDLEDEIARISTFYIHHQSAYFIGRDVNYPSALEGSQKLKELSYIHAEAYPAGELKHGANAVIDAGYPIICLAPQGRVYKKMISNIQQMKARQADILAIGTAGDSQLVEHADHTILLPPSSDEISVMLNTVAMQLFAYYVTLYKGYSIDNPRTLRKFYPKPDEFTDPPVAIDIDKPRNLAKSVTVE